MDYPGYTRLALHTPAHVELANEVMLAILCFFSAFFSELI